MVRHYIRKGLRQKWTEDSMRAALEAVIKNGVHVKRAAAVYKVPSATLARKVKQCRLDPERQNELLANPKSCAFQTLFTKEQENTLCEYINELENAMVGLLGTDVRRLAFQLAEKFNIPHRFKKDSRLAGDDWYQGFMKRNPHIKIKRGETPYEKSKVFSKEKVYKFFDSLENLIDKYNLKPSNLYNFDQTVIKCSSISIEDTGKSVKSKENQDKLVTAVISFSASGNYVPLLMVFPDKMKNEPLFHGAPDAAWALVNSSGQMQLEIFIRWLHKFIDVMKPTKLRPVLILIDGYHSYLKDLQVLEIMTENGIHMLCLPPYCSSKLQPSKHNFMDDLSEAYKSEVANWTPRQHVSVDEVSKLFQNAYKKVSTISAAKSCFESTGIWPYNRDLFQDQFISVSFNASSATNDSDSTPDSSILAFDQESTKMEINQSIPNDTVTHELHVSQNNFESYEVQDLNEIDQSQHSVHQEPFLNVANEAMKCETIPNDSQPSGSSVVIPPEAQLAEVQLEDLKALAQSQRKLYFYVSPYKLKLS